MQGVEGGPERVADGRLWSQTTRVQILLSKTLGPPV